MKKIGIATFYGLVNYGNRLQNYALQQVIRQSGFNTTTLILKPNAFSIKRIAARILKRENGKIRIKRKEDVEQDFIEKERIRNFKSFEKNHFDITYLKNNYATSNDKHMESLDKFVAGSDQIWNPCCFLSKNLLSEIDLYYLSFADPSKRISYAASFGVTEIPPECEEYRRWISDELAKFKAISVREESGARIVKKLIGKDVPVVLDPTLLLTAQEWRKIETHTLPADKKYVLTYFLGPQLKIVHTEVRKQAEESSAEVIEMMDWRSPYYILGPDGFLEMIDRAQAVFTDSFHGTVFCILFHKPFYIYQRFENDGRDANMFSRIDTLLSKTGLTQCVAEHRPPTEEEFARADKLLEKERAFSLRFLQEALSDTTVMN